MSAVFSCACKVFPKVLGAFTGMCVEHSERRALAAPVGCRKLKVVQAGLRRGSYCIGCPMAKTSLFFRVHFAFEFTWSSKCWTTGAPVLWCKG